MIGNLLPMVVIIMCSFLLGAIFGAIKVESYWKQEIVRRGFGQFTVDTNTVPSTFIWKNNTN